MMKVNDTIIANTARNSMLIYKREKAFRNTEDVK